MPATLTNADRTDEDESHTGECDGPGRLGTYMYTPHTQPRKTRASYPAPPSIVAAGNSMPHYGVSNHHVRQHANEGLDVLLRLPNVHPSLTLSVSQYHTNGIRRR